MDEEIERLVVSVRADTGAFAGDVARMKAELDGPLAGGAERAGRAIETALERAIRTGKFGFDDLKRLALSVLAEIAAASMSVGNPSGGLGGLVGGFMSLLGSGGGFFGLPGRATGGGVAGGRAYVVGERGPEVFVPTSSGRVETLHRPARGPVNITVNIAGTADGSRPQMVKSGQQVARAVRRALERAEG